MTAKKQNNNIYDVLQDHTHFSYVCSTTKKPLLGLTIGNCIDINAERFCDREAVKFCHQNVSRTFSQLKNDVDTLALGLIALGLKKGDRLGIWSPNRYEWILTHFAAAKTGLISVFISPYSQEKEIINYIYTAEPSVLVVAETFKNQHYHNLLTKIIPTLNNDEEKSLKDKRFPFLRNIVMMTEKDLGGIMQFDDVYNLGKHKYIKELVDVEKCVQFDDPAVILFTSGSTGNPKGAVLSHENITNNAYFGGCRLGYQDKTHRLCLPLPLFHSFGLIGSTTALVFGACAIYPSAAFNATETIHALQNEKSTIMYGVPTMYFDLLGIENFENFDLSHLQIGLIGAGPCSEDQFKSIQKKFSAINLTRAFGATELNCAIMSLPSCSEEYRCKYTGYLLDHQEAKIIDSQGRIVPLSTSGELCIRGHNVMSGYWKDPQNTELVITQERWYRTGDIAIMKKDGLLRVAGRLKDVIIRGGENIYPIEIENLLRTHEKIKEVSVVSVPDERLGEELCACIQIKEREHLEEEEVKSFCKGKISKFKIPRHVKFLDKMPMTDTGKIKKIDLQLLVNNIKL